MDYLPSAAGVFSLSFFFKLSDTVLFLRTFCGTLPLPFEGKMNPFQGADAGGPPPADTSSTLFPLCGSAVLWLLGSSCETPFFSKNLSLQDSPLCLGAQLLPPSLGQGALPFFLSPAVFFSPSAGAPAPLLRRSLFRFFLNERSGVPDSEKTRLHRLFFCARTGAPFFRVRRPPFLSWQVPEGFSVRDIFFLLI